MSRHIKSAITEQADREDKLVQPNNRPENMKIIMKVLRATFFETIVRNA